MLIETFETTETDTAIAAQTLAAAATASRADFVFVTVNAAHGADAFAAALAGRPRGALHASTSCLGAMTEEGHLTEAPVSMAALLLTDPDGDFGSAAAPFDGDPRTAARQATARALEAARRTGEVPDVVFVTTTPGAEEQALAGIADLVGPDTPILGGSAADNSVAGGWYVSAGDGAHRDGVAVSVLFPSTPVSMAYRNGYVPTDRTGRVTAVDGRCLQAIDGRPARSVYAEWTGSAVTDADGPVLNILSEATLWPLGRRIGDLHGIDTYLLAHPATAEADGGLTLFADVAEGETLTQMRGDPDQLADRAGRVAALARPADGSPVAGALMVYCGGCMLRVRDRMDRVVSGTREALDGAPFLGFFSFGEQGPILGEGNRHGNLMISCLVFHRAT